MTPPEAMSSRPMPHQAMGSPGFPPATAEDTVVETRFGPVTCGAQALIGMPQGPLGFADHRRFALLDLPNPQLARFRLLQSTSDPSVSFVVVPTDRENGFIAPRDVDEACAAAGAEPDDVVVLLVVTVRQAPTGTAMTVNLRAPVVLDVRQRMARQIVLSNPAYSVRHPL